VIAVDTNILVYAHRAEMPQHLRAKTKVTTLAEGSSEWAIPWPCIHEFLSAVTRRPGAFRIPTPLSKAISQVEAWQESPALVLLGETPSYWRTLQAILTKGDVTGPRVHDARIAAICLDHGVSELWTADRDFGRFPDLRVVNPLFA